MEFVNSLSVSHMCLRISLTAAATHIKFTGYVEF